MLQQLYHRLLAADVPIILHPSAAFRSYVLSRGFDPVFGARPLRRALEAELVNPLSRLIATGQILPGQVVGVGMRRGKPRFHLEAPPASGRLVV
ncbi:MAG: hypothetical protein EA402_05900 [Planctomycetota bacterium]|nr:MAG: hypothetical protein EA402_05900 [Planctomycetota bacterium]